MNNFSIDFLKEKLKNHRPGIIQKDEYFNSAVLIPITKIDNEYHLIFEKRAANIRQGGEISFPGGQFDAEDENPEETAIRETEEELGLNRSEIDVIKELGTFVGPMGVTVDAFIAEVFVDNAANLKIDTSEVEKAFSVPINFFLNTEPDIYKVRMEVQPYFVDEEGKRTETFPAKDLQLPEKYHTPWYGRYNKIYVYKTEGEIIWGITANIIQEFLKLA